MDDNHNNVEENLVSLQSSKRTAKRMDASNVTLRVIINVMTFSLLFKSHHRD